MKNTPLLFFTVLTVLFTTNVMAGATPVQLKFQNIYKATMEVDECSGSATGSPMTFGPKGAQMSLMTFAKLGSVMVGNDSKSFKLSADKGVLESYDADKQKWTKHTYMVDPKAFLQQLKVMNEFMNKALEVAQKEKDDSFAEKVTCSSKIIELTHTEYNKPTGKKPSV